MNRDTVKVVDLRGNTHYIFKVHIVEVMVIGDNYEITTVNDSRPLGVEDELSKKSLDRLLGVGMR